MRLVTGSAAALPDGSVALSHFRADEIGMAGEAQRHLIFRQEAHCFPVGVVAGYTIAGGNRGMRMGKASHGRMAASAHAIGAHRTAPGMRSAGRGGMAALTLHVAGMDPLLGHAIMAAGS